MLKTSHLWARSSPKPMSSVTEIEDAIRKLAPDDFIKIARRIRLLQVQANQSGQPPTGTSNGAMEKVFKHHEPLLKGALPAEHDGKRAAGSQLEQVRRSMSDPTSDGGSRGLRDMGGLESAVMQPQHVLLASRPTCLGLQRPTRFLQSQEQKECVISLVKKKHLRSACKNSITIRDQ